MSLKKEIIIISIVLFIISLALILIFIIPLLNSIKHNPMELIKVKKDLESFQNITGKTEDIKNIYEEVKPDLEKIDNLFAKLEAPIDLIKFFQATARENNLSINISPISSERDPKDYWDNLTFRLSLIGSYNNFMRFLEKIENGPYLIEDKEMSIKGLTQTEISLGYFPEDIKADLTIKVFVK